MSELAKQQCGKALIFCNSVKDVEMVAAVLQGRGHQCEAFSSNSSQDRRTELLDLFRSRDSRLPVLVSTQVLGRGMHFEDVKYVVNYDFPHRGMVDYVHRIGRTGRGNRKGFALTLLEEATLAVACPEAAEELSQSLAALCYAAASGDAKAEQFTQALLALDAAEVGGPAASEPASEASDGGDPIGQGPDARHRGGDRHAGRALVFLTRGSEGAVSATSRTLSASPGAEATAAAQLRQRPLEAGADEEAEDRDHKATAAARLQPTPSELRDLCVALDGAGEGDVTSQGFVEGTIKLLDTDASSAVGLQAPSAGQRRQAVPMDGGAPGGAPLTRSRGLARGARSPRPDARGTAAMLAGPFCKKEQDVLLEGVD
ncbi:unnamed protein product [Prorocentrum cordatum]|uniref:ATP-dependent RNA helicase n=1 Tax=Prorocentrum cordatum TaxID=2364126 RepID=A0ABN9SW16_9DINO|nr:unnamed protein product [Polarella glacialis]